MTRSPGDARQGLGRLRDADHRGVLWQVRGIPDPYDTTPGESRCPDAASMRAIGDRWQAAGTELAELADVVEHTRDRLFADASGGAAGALRERIDQIIRLARELAFRCDSGRAEPDRPWDGPPAGSDLDRGFRQLWDHLACAVERLGTEARIPRLPWDGLRFGTDFGVTWDDQDGRYVMFLNRPRRGGLPPERVEYRVDRDRMHALYESADVYTVPRHVLPAPAGAGKDATDRDGSAQDGAGQGHTGRPGAGREGIGRDDTRRETGEVRVPVTALDAHELFLHAGIDRYERDQALAAAAELADAYAEAGAEFPAAVPPPPGTSAGEQAAHIAHRSGRRVRKTEAPRRPVAPARGVRGPGG